jgi:hypothetical protein
MPQFVRMQRAMCVRKTVVGQETTYMLAPRSYLLLVSALGFALLASIAPNARAANPPDDLAKIPLPNPTGRHAGQRCTVSLIRMEGHPGSFAAVTAGRGQSICSRR